MRADKAYEMAKRHFNAIYFGGIVRGRNIKPEEIVEYVHALFEIYGAPTYIDCDDNFTTKELTESMLIRSLAIQYPARDGYDFEPQRIEYEKPRILNPYDDPNDYELLANYDRG